jgi:cytoskeletal protein CcmA (bactofilin family)
MLMFRRSRARATLLAIVATFALITPALAGDFRTDRSVTVAEGESIDSDLYVAAGQIVIDGTVNGDATIAGGQVRVNGTVNGSLNVGAGTVEVTGEVTGAVRVSAGTVQIDGSVGRDVVAFGGTVTIGESAEVAGDVAGGVGTLSVDGTVAGDLLAGAGTITVAGTVDGAIEAGVGQLTIESGAVVGGDVTYRSNNDAVIEDGSEIGGEVSREEPIAATQPSIIPDNPIVTYLGVLLGMLLLGWGLLAIRPRLTLGSADALRTAPLASLGIGLAALIGQFVVIALLALVGVLLAIIAGPLGGAVVAVGVVVLLLIVLAIILSVVPVAMAIGRLLVPGDRSPYLEYLAGAAILALIIVACGYVPALGGLVFLIVWVLGLGAFVVYSWRTRERPYVLPGPPATTVVEAPPA